MPPRTPRSRRRSRSAIRLTRWSTKLKETLKGDDTDAIKAATEELTQLFYAMSEKLYQQANPQGAQGAGPDMGGAQGGAQTGPDGQQYYDADYKVVDDDENKK